MTNETVSTMADEEHGKENSRLEPVSSRLRSSHARVAATSTITSRAQADLVIAQTSPDAPGFVRFPKLPLELRLKIWRDSFPEPRHVTVAVIVSPELKTRKLGSTQEPPVTLLV
ncbi:hypothetical protein ONS95_013744 [Cadophora gregata]|uniref:uncharacterized protein n=1 Tax=Cadophora gregata TaxID=51156 RepID=UPI0026DB10D2|nr:uncharacterized protein ONS95_013744 [Cadophora gregata]KAK0113486.1 hypothetical protein ONS96_014350 [Cadophora gregata f. sp. sojae]KAK0114245.1 hypothetical protein ONS95_013744 [Cadophora gregata]